MTKKYSRMERNLNWLNFKVVMSIVCIATSCNTANQMGHDAAGLPVVSAHSLVATFNRSSEDSSTTDTQHISNTNTDVKLSSDEETKPVLSNSKEATIHKWIFTRTHSQNSEHNMKNSMKGVLPQNYLIKNRQLIQASKSKQVPFIRFLLQSRSEDELSRKNLPLQQLHRKGQKRLRIKRENPSPGNPSRIPVTTSGGTATESNTEMSTTSGGVSEDFQDSGKTDKVLDRQIPSKLVDTNLKSTISVLSQSTKNVTEAILKPTEDPDNMTTLIESSVQVTTMLPGSHGASQSGSTTTITSDVQVAIEGDLISTEAQEVVPQTSVLQKRTSSWQQPTLPTTQVPSQTKPHTTTSSVPKSSKMTVPMSTNNTVLPITNESTLIIGSQVEDVHERMSDNELDPAYQLTNDAYWAFGSLTTVLLLLTACVLCTGLWKKRNHMSNPISDVTCHASPVRKRKTDLKDFLKKKLRHIKTLSLKDSPLTGSMEIKKHYKGRRNGKSNGEYSHRYDTIPLLERPGDDEDDEFIEWEQSEKDHSV